MMKIVFYIFLVECGIIMNASGQIAKDEKTFGWVGDVLFGDCQTSRCRSDYSRAEYCCRSGKNTGCCAYAGGNYGNGGSWGNGGANNGNYNNKPGSCPPYNGRKKRSPEQDPRLSGGRFNGGRWSSGGWATGGQGFNPGYNNNYGNGRCIRDSECPGSLKCCYLYNGYQCTQPQYFG